MISSRLRKRL